MTYENYKGYTMDQKSTLDDSNIELNSGLIPNLKRAESENDWFKQLFQSTDNNPYEQQGQNSIYGTPDSSQLQFLMGEASKKVEPEYHRESDAYDELKRMSFQAGGLVGYSGISRFNNIIYDELRFEKRASITSDNNLVDFSLIKGGFNAKNSNISLPGMDLTKPALTDSIHPLANRLKSNDSFAMMTARNFANSQLIDPPTQNIETLINKTDFPNFGNLLKLLKKHFNGMEITDKDLDLSKHELEIIGSIITRKYKGKINTPTETYFLSTMFTDIDQLDSNKRPEENYKFVFKRCIKFMKERLNAHEKKKMRKKQLEDYFYQYYFAEACTQNKMSMDVVRHPQKMRGSESAPKTINTEYICNVAKSKEFVKDFNSYMYRFLQKDYELSVNPKIDGMVKRWEDIFEQLEDKQAAVQQIIDYVLKNKKCKLPWTGKEIDAAMESVRVIFADCCAAKDEN